MKKILLLLAVATLLLSATSVPNAFAGNNPLCPPIGCGSK